MSALAYFLAERAMFGPCLAWAVLAYIVSTVCCLGFMCHGGRVLLGYLLPEFAKRRCIDAKTTVALELVGAFILLCGAGDFGKGLDFPRVL
jgi:hypothetical protein